MSPSETKRDQVRPHPSPPSPTPSPHPGERIIRELEAADRALVLAELAARCKLTTQQVSDALRPLVRCGDVERVGRGIYRRVGVRP